MTAPADGRLGVWDYGHHDERACAEVLQAVEAVFRSGRLILGPQVARFEADFSAWCGVDFGVGVNSGTDAILIALKALGLGEGDEVVTVANTAVPTISAIVSAGCVPRFVDVDPDTLLMDPARLEEAVTPRTRCILPVHLYGQCVPMERVREVAARHGLAVLEDCAQAHGATRHGVKAGAMSDLAAFSFYPTKILGGVGDGGMIVTRDAALAERARRLRMYGMAGRYCSEEHGYNSRLDEIQAAVLLRRLPRLDDDLRARRAIAARYDRTLAALPLVRPRTASGNEHAYYLYVVRHPERERLLAALAERGIDLNVSYRWPVHTMAPYRRFGASEGDMPHTEAAAHEVFSLPMHPGLSEADQSRVCEALEVQLS